ncbi:MAG: chloride channel protein [Verrucomicrobia bacterium]|nr:chloride channel protein [Verrucomicrobiota bacterium]
MSEQPRPSTIRRIIKIGASWIEQAKVRGHLFSIGVAIVIGVLCGFCAVGFRYLIGGVHLLLWSDWETSLEVLQAQPVWRIVLVPAVGGLIAGPIIYFFAREAKGHGVPEVMAAVALKNGVIRPRVAFVKALASAITIGSGGSAGREGPIIQIGSAIGSTVGQILRVSRRRLRTFVGCGAAAGIAATFNAPIAGALFSVEVILGEFGVSQFSPIVISSVLATVVARYYFGVGPVFEVPQYELVSGLELIPYMFLGILCGAVSVLFIKMLYAAEDFSDKAKVPEYLKPMIGGLLLGLIGVYLPHVYADGYTSINLALLNKLTWPMLLILLLAKVTATSLTLGSGGSGGVFAPSLFLGAMSGGLLGQAVAMVMGDSAGAAGGYALVAMGGVVAGTTHAPITAILIIFEITNNYSIILPLMTVCIISTLLSGRLSHESIYTLKLLRRGIDLYKGRALDPLKAHPVSQCMHTGAAKVPPEMPAYELVQKMVSGETTQFYVVTSENRLLGVVSPENTRRMLMHREGLEAVLMAEDFADEGCPVCLPTESLSQALIKFEHSGLPELPVVDDLGGRKLVGVLRYTELLAKYSTEIIKQDTAEGFAERATSQAIGKVHIAEGFSMMEWSPPSSLWGKTLIESQIPAKYGVRVMLVKKRAEKDKPGMEIAPITPGGDYVISEHDTLLVCGNDDDLDRIAGL